MPVHSVRRLLQPGHFYNVKVDHPEQFGHESRNQSLEVAMSADDRGDGQQACKRDARDRSVFLEGSRDVCLLGRAEQSFSMTSQGFAQLEYFLGSSPLGGQRYGWTQFRTEGVLADLVIDIRSH